MYPQIMIERTEALTDGGATLYGTDAVGGGFMNQLEWGSDLRGIPLPICDLAESLMNTSFDHNGPKNIVPFAL